MDFKCHYTCYLYKEGIRNQIHSVLCELSFKELVGQVWSLLSDVQELHIVFPIVFVGLIRISFTRILAYGYVLRNYRMYADLWGSVGSQTYCILKKTIPLLEKQFVQIDICISRKFIEHWTEDIKMNMFSKYILYRHVYARLNIETVNCNLPRVCTFLMSFTTVLTIFRVLDK